GPSDARAQCGGLRYGVRNGLGLVEESEIERDLTEQPGRRGRISHDPLRFRLLTEQPGRCGSDGFTGQTTESASYRLRCRSGQAAGQLHAEEDTVIGDMTGRRRDHVGDLAGEEGQIHETTCLRMRS